MAIGFFYGSLLLVWVVLFASIRKKPFTMHHFIVWITYGLYSLTYEIFFGEVLPLFYYIDPVRSPIYMLLASLLLYPAIAVMYLLYLPGKWVAGYTVIWIVALLLFEIFSIYTRTIVLTGWRVFPWSVVTYAVTFVLLYLYHGYLKRKLPESF